MQLCLFSENLDEMVSTDHIVRFIDIYVEKLDLIKLEIKNIESRQGRPGYNPTLYFKIFIYSYLNRLRSSRKIERECRRNLELIW
ncbi:MAG: transposase [bacterium]|nr:transposase [bacterium]